MKFTGKDLLNTGSTVSEAVYSDITVSEMVYGYTNEYFIAYEDIIRDVFPDFDSMIFYQNFEAALNGKNGLITFRYLDPTFAGQPGKTFWAESSYLVNVFDLEAPSAAIQYSVDPDSPTNKDIVAQVINIRDNRSAENIIKVYFEDDPGKTYNSSFTFTDNGSRTFVLEDYAGNKTYLTATVTGIDRTPPEVAVKFSVDGKEYDAVPDTTDSVYRYTGPYTNSNITVKVTDSETGEAYYNYVFNRNETISVTVSDAAGNETIVNVCVDKLDLTSPEPDSSSITYYVDGNVFTGTVTNKKVTASFTVRDHVTSDPSSPTTEVKVSRLNMRIEKVMTENGVAYTETTVLNDTGLVKSLGGDLFEIEFEYNGTADIYFTDEAGNEAMITVTADMIDRIPPTVKDEIRTSEKGVPVNKPVTVTVYPDEACDGWITSDKGEVLVQRRGLSTAPLTYTFDKENDGNSNMVWFHFEDAAGNQIKYQVTGYDIDKTKPVLKFELVAVNKAVPVNKVLPVDRNEAEKKLIPKNGVVTYRISVDPSSTVTKTSKTLDQFTGGIMDGDTVELVNRSNLMYHTFTANGDYIFYYIDKAGNMNSYTLNVNCIDDNKPDADVTYSPAKAAGNTNKDVVITISPYDIDANKERTNNAFVYWNGKKYLTESGNTFTYTVKENGNYEFVVTDDSGNTNTIKAVVDWIDKEAPVIQSNGYADIYVSADEEDANANAIKKKVKDLVIADNMDGNIPVDDARVTVDYYMSDGVTPVDIDTVDFSKEGEYLAIVKAKDRVGNESQLPRKIVVLGSSDVLPLVNGVRIMPSGIANFDTADLTLQILNLKNAGGTVYYSFVKGEYHPAELKGNNKKSVTMDKNEIKLETEGSGIYTLVITTQERKTVVVYIFVGSSR